MRILIVGNFAQKIPGGFYYNFDFKLRNGLIRNGHTVLEFSDRDQARLSNMFGSRKLGVGGANEKLLATVENYLPDLILFGHANVIRNETIAQIRATWPHTRIGLYNIDTLALAEHIDNVTHLRGRANVVDAMFITTGGDLLKQFLRPHNTVSYMPNAVDPSIEVLRNFDCADLPVDFLFCIGGASPNDTRLEISDYLKKNLSGITMEFYGLYGRPSVWGGKYLNVLSDAKMSLNFSRPNNAYLYASDRMAHIMGNGILALTPESSGFKRFFGGHEIAYYSDPSDLADKIKFYAANDDARRAVAKAGWEKSHRDFNCKLVAQYIVDVTMRQKMSHDYVWQDELYKM